MDKETQVIKMYKEYIGAKSIFGDACLILPSTPQSFSKFPTIVIKEKETPEIVKTTSFDRSEYADSNVYQIDIYAKDITIGNTKYASRSVINELKRLSFDFIRKYGYTRSVSTQGETLDTSVKRYIIVFNGITRSWNTSL